MTNHPNRSKQQQQAKHTPGPWAVHLFFDHGTDDPANFSIFTDDGQGNGNAIPCREDTKTEWEREEAKANARLIAAAPDLLAALKLIRRMGSGLIDGEKTAAEVLAKCSTEAGVAIDKAEGR